MMLKLKTLRTLVVAPLMIALLATTTAQAAETAKPKAYLEARFPWRPILHVDQQRFELGWFDSTFAEAAPAFASNPKAAEHFSEYLSDSDNSQYLLWGTFGAFVGVIVLNETRWNLPSREEQLLTNGIFYGGIVSSLALVLRASNHFNDAINTLNGVNTGSESTQSSTKLSFAPALMPSSNKLGLGGGLSMQLEF